MTNFNCLPEGETLQDLIRREHIESFNVMFLKDMNEFRNDDEFGTDFEPCTPSEATIATLYGVNDLNEGIAIHDVPLTAAGAKEIGAACAALFAAIIGDKIMPEACADFSVSDALRTGASADIWFDAADHDDADRAAQIAQTQQAMTVAADMLDQIAKPAAATIWLLATDTKNGTELFGFNSQAAFDAHMHRFMSSYWDEDRLGEMPDSWHVAWDAMDNQLGDLDTFQWDELDISAHPAIHKEPADLANAEDYRAYAQRQHHREGEVEIDDRALVARGDDDGAYVQAWIWVSDADAGVSTVGEDE